MKRIINRKNLRRLNIIFLTGFVLITSGCMKQSEKSTIYNDSKQNASNSRVIENQVSREESIEESIVESSITSEVSLETEESLDKFTTNDLIDYLENIDDKITSMAINAKDEIVEDYHIVYDFIFNEGTIKGYTFDELKENTKAKVLDIYFKIDTAIEEKYPSLKPTIEEKFKSTKEKAKNKLSNLKEELIDYIGQDKYDFYLEKKDQLVDKFKEQTKEDVSELKDLAGSIWQRIKGKK